MRRMNSKVSTIVVGSPFASESQHNQLGEYSHRNTNTHPATLQWPGEPLKTLFLLSVSQRWDSCRIRLDQAWRIAWTKNEGLVAGFTTW
jgi:hypothetical protein